MHLLNRNQLYQYQHKLINFVKKNKNSFIIVGMGLGKTVSLMTYINDFHSNSKNVIIAPKTICNEVWNKEFLFWEHLTNTIKPIVLTGKKIDNHKKYKSNLFILTYDSINRALKSNLFKDIDCLILDESTYIKNPSTNRFKSLKKALQYKPNKTILLTGEPSPSGKLWELFAQMYCIDPTIFGLFHTKFIKKYYDFNPWQPYLKTLKIGSKEKIKEKIKEKSFLLRSEDYLKLPPIVYNNIKISLNKKTKKIYNEAKKDFYFEFNNQEHYIASAAILSNKLIQISAGAFYDHEKNINILHFQKVNQLKELIESIQEPILVYYWFNFEQVLINSKIKNIEFINGKTSTKQKRNIIERWNNGEIKTLVAHPAVIGHGLNLQYGSNLCVWLTVPWSVGLYHQAIARLHRTGQKKPVIVNHIVNVNTIDEHVCNNIIDATQNQDEFLLKLKQSIEKDNNESTKKTYL